MNMSTMIEKGAQKIKIGKVWSINSYDTKWTPQNSLLDVNSRLVCYI